MTDVQQLPAVTLGSVTVTGTLKADDSGHLVIHLQGSCGTDKCEHRVTIGAADGHDALSTDSKAVQDSLQTALDDARAHVQKVLSVRAAVRSVAGQLK
jgi:hypothetical protein